MQILEEKSHLRLHFHENMRYFRLDKGISGSMKAEFFIE